MRLDETNMVQRTPRREYLAEGCGLAGAYAGAETGAVKKEKAMDLIDFLDDSLLRITTLRQNETGENTRKKLNSVDCHNKCKSAPLSTCYLVTFVPSNKNKILIKLSTWRNNQLIGHVKCECAYRLSHM
ncbi:hypothetical protein HNY73_011085 [Argiope bruennichi]|uniref:Uncharacterized protein n=1 Tax=Argiope bruennichi TaxID=94029 RepID=A0A8T0F5M1_ARGBR|nr:hypothetical protein HNY73_011085 [Argiope bruennichi]